LIQLIRFILLTICLSIVSALAVASEAPVKIGVLDWQQLLSKAPQAEEAGKRLDKEFQKPKEQFINKQKEFQTKRDKLQRDKDVMSGAERGKKEKELAKMEQDLRRLDEELRADITTRHREEMDDFIKVVREAVEKMAVDEKFDLILSQEAALYVSERIDITSKILEQLEKTAKTAKAEKNTKADKKSDN